MKRAAMLKAGGRVGRTIYFEADLYERAQQQAQAEGRSFSSFVEICVRLLCPPWPTAGMPKAPSQPCGLPHLDTCGLKNGGTRCTCGVE